MKRRGTLTLFAGCLSLLAGCPYVDYGVHSSISFDGEFQVRNAEFSVEGELEEGGAAPVKELFRDVSVRLYTASKEEFFSKQLGNLSAGGSLPVSISSARIPEFVIFDSRDFWGPNIDVTYYARDDETQYIPRVVNRRAAIPVFSA